MLLDLAQHKDSPPVVASTSGMPRFNPIISFADDPRPSLVRSPNPSSAPTNSAEADLSSKISSYKKNPTSIVGQKFRFKDGNRIWEASTIVFDRHGWGSVTVEGERERHAFDFEVILSMLKHGVLDEV